MNNSKALEKYIDGTIGHGINKEAEVKHLVKKFNDLQAKTKADLIEKIVVMKIMRVFPSHDVYAPDVNYKNIYNQALNDVLELLKESI